MEELHKISYDKDSGLQVSFQTDEHFRFLYCQPVGQIKNGSEGNISADFLFGKICQYYFQTHCYVLILDFSKLEYHKGDRLRKSINFFQEIGRNEEEKGNPVLLIKPNNSEGIDSLIEWIKPANLIIVEGPEQAMKISEKLFDDLIA